MSTKDTNNDSQPYQCLSVAIQIIFGANWLKRKVEEQELGGKKECINGADL